MHSRPSISSSSSSSSTASAGTRYTGTEKAQIVFLQACYLRAYRKYAASEDPHAHGGDHEEFSGGDMGSLSAEDGGDLTVLAGLDGPDFTSNSSNTTVHSTTNSNCCVHARGDVNHYSHLFCKVRRSDVVLPVELLMEDQADGNLRGKLARLDHFVEPLYTYDKWHSTSSSSAQAYIDMTARSSLSLGGVPGHRHHVPSVQAAHCFLPANLYVCVATVDRRTPFFPTIVFLLDRICTYQRIRFGRKQKTLFGKGLDAVSSIASRLTLGLFKSSGATSNGSGSGDKGKNKDGALSSASTDAAAAVSSSSSSDAIGDGNMKLTFGAAASADPKNLFVQVWYGYGRQVRVYGCMGVGMWGCGGVCVCIHVWIIVSSFIYVDMSTYIHRS